MGLVFFAAINPKRFPESAPAGGVSVPLRLTSRDGNMNLDACTDKPAFARFHRAAVERLGRHSRSRIRTDGPRVK